MMENIIIDIDGAKIILFESSENPTYILEKIENISFAVTQLVNIKWPEVTLISSDTQQNQDVKDGFGKYRAVINLLNLSEIDKIYDVLIKIEGIQFITDQKNYMPFLEWIEEIKQKKIDAWDNYMKKGEQSREEIKHPDKISGIYRLQYLINEDMEKKIYLLYDYHGTIGECQKDDKTLRVNDWIKNVLEESGLFIDVFLETTPSGLKFVELKHGKTEVDLRRYSEMMGDNPPDEMHSLLKSGILFENCFDVDKKDCEYKNARIHYTDLRPYIIQKYNDLQKKISSGKYNENVIDDLNKEEFKKDFTDEEIKFIKDIINLFEDKKNLLNFVNDMLETSKIEKQLNAVDSDIKNKIYIFIADSVTHLFNLTKENKKVVPFVKLFDDILLNIMDSYLLGRIFKTFDTSKNLHHPKKASNIIIYAGGMHCSIYKNFLSELDFKIVEDFWTGQDGVYTDITNLCLSVSGMKFPYFQDIPVVWQIGGHKTYHQKYLVWKKKYLELKGMTQGN